MAEQRKTIELLPVANQTATLSKFFNATVDHLFQEENTEFLSGYIGDHPAWYNPDTDFYIQEPTADRENYQLVPTALSRDPNSGNVNQILFYDDLVNKLRLQGAIVDNPERLFNAPYYSWCPPIDIDMFVNWSLYHWVPQGPVLIDLLDPTDFVGDIRGRASYTYTGNYSIANADGTHGTVIQTGSIPFTTGLKIRFSQDAHVDYENIHWLVCNVGRNIILQDDTWAVDVTSPLYKAVESAPDYFTLERGCVNANTWSITNRWFHIGALYPLQTNGDPVIQNQQQANFGQRAVRPILQYFRNLTLFNQGTLSRGYFTVVSHDANLLNITVGQAAPVVNGHALQDGDLVLSVDDLDPNVKGRIWKVSGLSTIHECVMTAQPRSTTDSTTDAHFGDQVIRIDVSGVMETWHYDGTTWIVGQSRYSNSDPRPLFELYDSSANNLDDPAIYPTSNFTGSYLFSYSIADTSGFDPVLGLNPQFNAFGDYVFQNYQKTDTWQYVSDNKIVVIPGYPFAKIQSDQYITDEYINGWYLSSTLSRQYYNLQFQVVNNALVNTGELNSRETSLQDEIVQGNLTTLDIYDPPAPQVPRTLPSLFVTRARGGQVQNLIIDQDYTLTDATITLLEPAKSGDMYFVKNWLDNQLMTDPDGYYDIPWNLANNPNNEEVTYTSLGEYLEHVTSLISNQTGIVGDPRAVNNWRDTARDPNLGMYIMQHDASMLKLAVLNSTSQSDINAVQGYTDPQVVMTWAEKQYLTWYGRFINALFNLYNNQGYTLAHDPQVWITSAMRTVNLGKSVRSAWANSGYDQSLYAGSYCDVPAQNPTWIPATGTRLGITSAYYPAVYVDASLPGSPLMILTHDGARISMTDSDGNPLGDITNGSIQTSNTALLSNPVAAAWLQFELNLYLNLPARYRNTDIQPTFNITAEIPGKWRSSDYTRSEYIQVQRASFDKWLISTQANATANTTFDITDEFSFNYRNVLDLNGQPIPGYWRGMYQWFYDTDRPDQRPWEMLGFSQEPSWWQAEYGSAPYTSGNGKMWLDLSQGFIRQGTLAGYHSTWARPGLLTCIPVDSQGALQAPLGAGIVTSLPSTVNAKADWIFGDGAPVEQAWRNSQSTSFIQAWTGYLLKPAQFVDLNWDSLRTEVAFVGTAWPQMIYTDVQRRKSSSEFLVHREDPITLSLPSSLESYKSSTYFGSCGLQHWFSEYLVNNSQSVTMYLGNIIRGADVSLGHKFAGYVKSDSMRILVDSFGQLDYQSRIVPQENQHVYLYRSGSIGEYFYSGVVVQIVNNGYKVFGYDAINAVFNVIPNNVAGLRHVTTLGNLKVTFYQQGLSTTESVGYGTIFNTPQQVVDFLTSYGRWLEAQGWIFDSVNNDNNQIVNWEYAAQEFVFWCQAQWGNDNFIALSPASSSLVFSQTTGQIQYVNGSQSGVYPVVNKTGTPIVDNNLVTLREDSQLTIEPTNGESIYGARLFVTTLEHAMLLDNLTQFNDIIYQPLYAQRQSRVKVFTYRTLDWDGKLQAPGYFLQRNADNTYVMTDNFEKTAQDFRFYFNIDQPKHYHAINNSANTLNITQTQATGVDQPSVSGITQTVNQQPVVSNQIISNLAKHTFGYQKRDYLQNLILEDATEFEFYQGYVRQKGTYNSIQSILRNSNLVPTDASFQYFEEFALRLGQYGGTSVNNIVEFYLQPADVISNPQWISLFSQADTDNPDDDVINLVPGDSRIVTAPESYETMKFALRSGYQPDPLTDTPTAGYVQLGETTWQITTVNDLLTLWDNAVNTASPVVVGDTVWQFYTDIGSWTAYVLVDTGITITSTLSSQNTAAPTTIICDKLVDLADGDIVIVQNITGVSGITGTYTVSNVNVANNSFQIDVSTFDNGTGGGTIWKYFNTRFTTVQDRDTTAPTLDWPQGLHVYVDQGDQISGAWTVYSRLGSNWIPVRNQQLQVDSTLLQSTVLYDSTYQNPSLVLQYFDPIQGRIPSIADADLVYKRESDPAKYNYGDSANINYIADQSWSDAHVGETWWDLSAVRYVDYHQGDLRYRVKNWGKLAPGTTVDIYEWVRSPVSPTLWSTYVADGTDLSQFGVSYTPSGVVLNETDPNWTQTTVYNADGSMQTWYYFWVKNSTMTPAAAWRTLTTQEISNIITNPPSQAIPWWSAIDPQNILVANVKSSLTGPAKILQINWQDAANDSTIHSQWQLIRPGDVRSIIDPQFWQKLVDSLVGWDGLGYDVPDYRLNSLKKLGTLFRPRQSWFANATAAGEIFVYVVNKQIAAFIDPLVVDSSKSLWYTYFTLTEPQPPSTEWQYHVANLTERDALIPVLNNGDVVLVDANVQTQNRWTMYQYQGNSQWYTIQVQAWDTADYWQYVDWYAAGYDQYTLITQTVATPVQLNLLTDVATGSVVKVLNNGHGAWQWFTWTGSSWQLVAQQNASVLLLPTLYDNSINLYNWDQAPFDSILFDQNASMPFYNIIQGLRDVVLGALDQNLLITSMMNYVLSEQGFVDWITKTSFIVLTGFSLPLSESQLYASDNIESLLQYINEVKPYRSKVREFITTRTKQELYFMRPTDFDKPPLSLAGGITRILDPDNTQDQEYMQTHSQYQDWYAQYQTSVTSHLVRELRTTIYFDRISSDIYGWDYSWEDRSGYSGTSESETWGAISRIRDLYKPTPDLPPLSDIDALLQSEYRGEVLDTLSLLWRAGWNGLPWNYVSGWDNNDNLYDYLDLVIQGGEVPEYDIFTPDPTGSSNFNLSYIPQAVAETVVWVDHRIAIYGTDFIIPNWITAAKVVNPGSGYQVGDTLEFSGGNNLISARLQVTAVSPLGAIQSLSIIRPGAWDIVPVGVIPVFAPEYIPNQGTGATILPTWGGTSLVLTQNTVNKVYVLYHGQTFHAAPNGEYDTVYDGYRFLQPDVNSKRPPELVALRIPNSIRWDITNVEQAGVGAANRVYITDGITDRFDLGIIPENNNAVIAWLDGVKLNTTTTDFFVNYQTGIMVFGVPPAAGKELITWSLTGPAAGNTAKSVAVVNPGTGYAPGNNITLHGDTSVTNTIVTVNSVKINNNVIVNSGQHYNVGDLIYWDIGSSYPASWVVTNVGVNGSVTSVDIKTPGEYTTISSPVFHTVNSTNSNVTGSGATINTTNLWGVSNVTVTQPGLWVMKDYPVIDSNNSHSGNLATFGVIWDQELQKVTVLADGITSTYTLNNPIVNKTYVRVVVDGDIVDAANVSISGASVTVSPVPGYNSQVVIEQYQTNTWSNADNQIIATSGSGTYPLNNPPNSSESSYASIQVVNVTSNIMLASPQRELFVVNNPNITTYPVTISSITESLIQVYLDERNLVLNTDYTLGSGSITFVASLRQGAIVELVYADPAFGYDWALSGNNILIQSDISNAWNTRPWAVFPGWGNATGKVSTGDKLQVLTMPQDASWQWQLEEFDVSTQDYQLLQVPTVTESIQVYAAGQPQALGTDYTVVNTPGVTTIHFISGNPTSPVLCWYAMGVAQHDVRTQRVLIRDNQTWITNLQSPTKIVQTAYATSDSIEVADYKILTPPARGNPGLVWIENELVAWWNIQHTPTAQYPNKAILSNLWRNYQVTAGNPVIDGYQSIWFSGDGSTTAYAVGPGLVNLSVCLDNQMQAITQQYTYSSGVVTFIDPPDVGYRNIRFTWLATSPDRFTTQTSHQTNSAVYNGSAIIEAI